MIKETTHTKINNVLYTYYITHYLSVNSDNIGLLITPMTVFLFKVNYMVKDTFGI